MAVPDGATQGAPVTFLPHRLNRQPVVVRGLTADELWICAGLFGALGLLAGLPLVWLGRSIAMLPTTVVASVALGVFAGGRFLRRQKRGRPETWLYRQLQWRIAMRWPLLAPWTGGRYLVTRSGRWSTRRTADVKPRATHRSAP